jgi:predicted O-methyltransferase YrrM
MTEHWWQSHTLGNTPWIGPQAVKYLEGLLEPDFEVLEHGSGGSTIWFSERVRHVTAVEADDEWYRKVAERVNGNVTLKLWKQDRLPSFGRKRFNLLLIDGEPVEHRIYYMMMAAKLVKPGGYVVLDNANRPEYEAERLYLRRRLKWMCSINCNMAPTRYLVTDFFRVPEVTE